MRSRAITPQGERLFIKDAQFTGYHRIHHIDAETIVELGKKGSAIFSVNMPEDGYYAFKIRYCYVKKSSSIRVQCLIDNRIIGTTYFSKDRPPLSEKRMYAAATLGTQLVCKGLHKIEIRAMFEYPAYVNSIEILRTDRVVDKPVFSFIMVSDTHIHNMDMHKSFSTDQLYMGRIPMEGRDGIFEYPSNWINRMLYKRMPEIMKYVLPEINRLKPDFVIHCGDLSGDRKEYLITAKRLLDKLNVPYYIVRGNHDPGNDLANIFSRHIGNDKKLYYVFNYKDFCFIILDGVNYLYEYGITSSWKADKKNGEIIEVLRANIIPPEETGWLKATLKKNKRNKVFVFLHFPLLVSKNSPQPYVSMRLGNFNQVLDILEQHRNVMAVFAGHSHINETRIKKNIHYFQVPSLSEYPMLYRQVVVFPSHVEVRSYQLPKTYLEESFLVTTENIFNSSDNGWVIGRNSDLYTEIKYAQKMS